MGEGEEKAVSRHTVHLTDMYDPIDKPIRLSFQSHSVEELRLLMENSNRRCLLILDSAGPPDPFGSRDVVVRLEPI
mgnify:CR=1 FL=1